jgi:RNase P/RNase MRP subunit p30
MNIVVVDFHARRRAPVVIIGDEPSSTMTILGPADALRYLKICGARSDRVYVRAVDLCQHALLNGVDAELSRPHFLAACANQGLGEQS